MASPSPLPVRRGISPRRLLMCVLGEEGYRRLRTAARHLLQWIAYVALVEGGAFVILRILAWCNAESSLSGRVAIAIHTGIAILAMVGFLVAELMDQIQYVAKGLARVGACWKRAGTQKMSESTEHVAAGQIHPCHNTPEPQREKLSRDSQS
jgi:hypothetical protein